MSATNKGGSTVVARSRTGARKSTRERASLWRTKRHRPVDVAVGGGGKTRGCAEPGRSEWELADFFDNAALGLHWVGPDGTILKVNRFELNLFGYSADDYIGHNVAEFHADKHIIADILSRLRAGEELQDYPARIRCKDSSIRHVVINSNVLWEGGKFVHTRCLTRDVTAQRQAEEAARESEQRLRDAIDALPAAVYTTDANGRITHFNQACVRLSGRVPKLGRDRWTVIWKLYRPDGRRMRRDQSPMATALKEGRMLRGVEAIAERPDGSRIWFMPVPTPLRDASGRTVGGINMLVDISDRKQTEAILAEAARQREVLLQFVQRRAEARSLEEIYSSALDAIIDTLRCDRASILLLDQKGVMRLVAWRGLSAPNRRAVEGYSPWKPDDEKPQSACIEDVDLAQLPKSFKASVRREGIGAAAFIPLLYENNLIGQLMIYYNAPHAFGQDEITVALNIGGQLALGIERKSAEEAVRRSEARHRGIISQSVAGIAETDRTGLFAAANDRFCAITGYSREELVDRRSIQDITSPDDLPRNIKLFRACVKHGTSFDIEKQYIRKDGSRIDVHNSVSAIRDSSGRVQSIVAVCLDITARKKAEEWLRQSKDALERAVVERTEELRGANRELQATNESLGAEMARRQELEREILQITERERAHIGHELHDMVCQELTATALWLKSTANQMSLEQAKETLNDAAEIVNRNVVIARDLARGFYPVLRGRGSLLSAFAALCRQANAVPELRCKLSFCKVLRATDETVALTLFRVAQEALRNAVAHANASEIVVSVEQERDLVRLSVADNGKGLRASKRTRGLGLHIMRYRSNALGGTFTIDSRPNNGTKIICELPLHP